MKQICIISAVVAVIMTLLVVTGKISFNQSNQQAINRGNQHYLEGQYDSAIEAYEEVLANEENNRLASLNLGLAYYQMKNYEKAGEHLSKSEDVALILGNTYYRLGSNEKEPTKQLELYNKSLDSYRMGIMEDSQNVELKYNYEYVKKLLDQQQQQQNQENNQDGKDDRENQDKQDSSKDNQEGQDQEEQQNQEGQNQEEQQDQQEQQDQEGQQGQENQQNKQDQEKQQQGSDEKQEEKEGQQGQASEEGEPTDEEKAAIEQVLRMLEQQEKQSLKNNQAVIRQGKEEDNDW